MHAAKQADANWRHALPPGRHRALAFWSAAVLRRFSSMRGSRKTIVSRPTSDQSCRMPQRAIPWPHAPTHQLSEVGTYFVTAGTYLKAHHFRGSDRLRVLHRGLLTVAQEYGWLFEAWAVFSNHYHFVAHSPPDASNLSDRV